MGGRLLYVLGQIGSELILCCLLTFAKIMTLDAKTCQSLTLNSLLVGHPEDRILTPSLICFQSTCHVPPVIAGQIFSWCDDNNDCYVTDSECRNHSSGHTKCQCEPGLSHDPGSNTCVTGTPMFCLLSPTHVSLK